MPITQVISTLPAPPDPLIDDANTFASKASIFTQKMVLLGTEMNIVIGQINALTVGSVYGDRYVYDSTTTAADPTTGKLRLNNATPSAATALYISETDADSLGKAAWLATWDDNAQTLKGVLRMIKASAPTTYADYQITGALTDNGTWDTFNLTYIGGSGSFTNGDSLVLQYQRYGADGATATFLTPNRQIAANTTLTSADNGNEIEITASGVTVTADTPVNLGNGFTALLIDSAWDWTLSGTFSDGSTSKKIMARTIALLQCDGSGLRLVTFSDYGYRNKLRNPKFEVAQRGTSIPVTTATVYTLDGWRWVNSSAGTATISQQTDVPAWADYQYSLRMTVGTGDNSVAAGDFAVIEQPIEGFLVRDLVGNPVAIRFDVRSPLTGTHCVVLRNSGLDRSYVFTYTVNAANTWEQKTLLLPAGLISAGTWNYTTGVGLFVAFVLMSGTTTQTTAGAWQTGNFLSTSAQVNVMATAGNIFAIGGPQLEKANAPTPLEHRDIANEYAFNYRYLEVYSATAANQPLSLLCTNWLSNTAYTVYPMRARKRAAPSIVVGGSFGYLSGNVTYTVNSYVITQITDSLVEVQLTVTSATLTVGWAGWVRSAASTDIVQFTSEL